MNRVPLPNLHAPKVCALVGLTYGLPQGSSSTQRPNAGVCLWAYQAFPDGDLSAWREREAHWKGKGSGEEWRWVYQDETDSTLGVKKICDFYLFHFLYSCAPYFQAAWGLISVGTRTVCVIPWCLKARHSQKQGFQKGSSCRAEVQPRTICFWRTLLWKKKKKGFVEGSMQDWRFQ